MKKATTLLAFLLFAVGLMAQKTPQQDTVTTILNTGEIAVFGGCGDCEIVIVFLSTDKVIVRQMPQNKPQTLRQTVAVTRQVPFEQCTCEGCVNERANRNRTKEKY